MWTPDVYEGAPAPTAAFLATVSKGGVVALLLRWVAAAGGDGRALLASSLALLAVLSMLAGTGLALRQENLKRLLAYSSIAHVGFLLVTALAAGPLAVQAAGFYLVAYALAILGGFGAVALLSGAERDRDRIAEYHGLFWRRPGAALVLTLSLLSLGGLPITAGFVGKLVLVATAVEGALWLPLATLAVASVAALFYYLRVVATLFAESDAGAEALPAPAGLPARAALAAGAIERPTAARALCSRKARRVVMGQELIVAASGRIAGSRAP